MQKQLTDEQQQAVDEFRRQVEKLIRAADNGLHEDIPGIRYALEMAAAECELLGIDPSTITSTGSIDSNV